VPEVTFLGTTCMQPTKDRNHSGIHITHNGTEVLFDCGEGIQRQMKIAGFKNARLAHICISHWHGDHVLGLPGLLSSMAANEYSKTLHIWGPKGSKKKFKYMQKAFVSHQKIKIELHEVSKSGVIFEGKDFFLEAQKLSHSVPCYGYALREKDKRRIKVSLVKKLGLKGPILGLLQKGEDVVHNKKKIKSKNVSTLVVGKKVAYVADTKMCPEAVKLAKGSDLLISESTFHSDEKKLAKKMHHMTSLDAGKVARRAKVKELILTHPSLRYKDVSQLVKDAKKEFKKVKFAKDFMIIKI